MKDAAVINLWIDERNVDRLRDYVADGWTAGQIAKRMGVTRNAIMGKIFRMGLRLKTPASVKDKGRNTRQRPIAMTPARAPAPKINPKRLVMDVGPDLPFKRPWLERKYNQCAWPIGEGADTWSCCAPTDEGANYCPVHHRIMFIPAKPHKKRSQERSDLHAARAA